MEEFFEKYGIKKYSVYRDFKFGPKKVALGKEELKRSQEKGIECKHIGILKEKDIDDMMYWYEYHYPEITDTRLLKLLLISSKHGFYFDSIYDRENLLNIILKFLIDNYTEDLQKQILEVF